MSKTITKERDEKLTQAAELLSEVLELYDPPEKLEIWEWAEKYRMLPRDVTAVHGRYRVENAPFEKEPQESFLDPEVQVTVLDWASRMGKTEMINNLEGYTIHQDPRHMLVVYPTLDRAKRWSKEFLVPMIENCGVLRELISDPRSRDSDNTILSKRFPGGRISGLGANSPSGFRQIQAPVILCDEIDGYENNAEGDPVALAFRRADNYKDCIQVLSSSPTEKGLSRIEEWLERSDYRKWFVPCLKCGFYFVMMWKDIDFTKRGTEREPFILCPDCAGAHDDAGRVEMVMNGEWRPTQEFVGIRGYWLNGMNSPFPQKKGFVSKMHQMVADFLFAKHGGRETTKTWINTFLAETYEEEHEKIEASDVEERVEDYSVDPMPSAVLMVTLGADIHPDRIEAEFVGWGLDEESWGLGYHILEGDTERDEVWGKLDALTQKEFVTTKRVGLVVARSFIDMGFKPERVLGFCKPRQAAGRPIYPCKGRGTTGVNQPPIVEGRASTNNALRIRHYNVGSNAAKALIYDRLLIEAGMPRSMHFPREYGYDGEFFKQLTAERSKVKYSFGRPYRTFINPKKDRNEALDIRCYATAAMLSMRPDFRSYQREIEKIEKQGGNTDEKKKDEEQPAPNRAAPMGRAKWINKWK